MSSSAGDSAPSSSAAAAVASSSSSSSRTVTIEYTFPNVHLMLCLKTFETSNLLRLSDLALDLAQNRTDVASQKETAAALEQSRIAIQSAKQSHAKTAELARDVFQDFERSFPGELGKRPLTEEEQKSLSGAAADHAVQVRMYRDLRHSVDSGSFMIDVTERKILQALVECKRPANDFRKQTDDAIDLASEALEETHAMIGQVFRITTDMEKKYVETIHAKHSKDPRRHKAANAASHCDYRK